MVKQLTDTLEVIEATISVIVSLTANVCEDLEANLRRSSSISELAAKLAAIINHLPDPVQEEIYRILGT